MARVRYRPRAETDLDSAFAWYSENGSLDLAARFYRAVFATAEELASDPCIGSPRWQWVAAPLEGLRCWAMADFPYLIFYRACDDGIEVVRVLHGTQDIAPELGTDDS